MNVGEYEFSGRDGRPLGMEISSLGPWPELTLLHEIGHWIDQQAFGSARGFGTATGAWPEMTDLLENGDTAKEIRRRILSGKTIPGGKKDIWPWRIAELKASLPVEEMFARGYAQWLASESRHTRLQAQLDRADILRRGLYRLLPNDAKRFNLIIRDKFKNRGWL